MTSEFPAVAIATERSWQLSLLSIIFLINSLAVTQQSHADEDAIELLDTLARAYRANQSAMPALEVRGRMKSVLGMTKPRRIGIINLDEDDVKRIESLWDGHRVEFVQEFAVRGVVDFANDRLRSSFRQVEDVIYRNRHLNRELRATPLHPQHREGIVSPDGYFSVYEGATAGLNHQFYQDLPYKEGGSRMIERRDMSVGRYAIHSDVFDPRLLMQVFGGPIATILTATRDASVRGVFLIDRDEDVANTGNTVLKWKLAEVEHKLEITNLGIRPVISTAELRYPDGATFTVDWEYEVSDGLFFPMEWTDAHRNSDGQIVDLSSVSVAEWTVDSEVDQAIFLPTALATDTGDRLVDYETEEVTVFLDDTFVSQDEFRHAVRDGVMIQRQRHQLVTMVCGFLFLLGCIGLMFFRRDRDRNSPAS